MNVATRLSAASLNFALFASLASASGCAEGHAPLEAEDQGAVFRMAMVEGTDVTSYELIVTQTDCSDSAVAKVDDPYENVWDVPMEGYTGELNLEERGSSSSNTLLTYGVWNVALDAGCYEASATPLGTTGAPSVDCAPSHPVAFELSGGEPENVLLISSCDML